MLKSHSNIINICCFILEQVEDLKWKLENKDQLIRNRRYACMLKMIKEENPYFSEDEMIQRDPELYEEIVGQYLSAVEKQARKAFDVKNCSLVEILYKSIDLQDEKLRKNEAPPDPIINDESEQLMNEDEDTVESQWGNFDGEKKTAATKKRKCHFITKGEQDMLKEEWTGIMYNNFLNGKDTNHFDYTEIDGNDIYDETSEKDQDCQDKYFDDEDEASIKSAENCNKSESDEDEDDLDVYMKHIESHINQENHDVFKEEFDD